MGGAPCPTQGEVVQCRAMWSTRDVHDVDGAATAPRSTRSTRDAPSPSTEVRNRLLAPSGRFWMHRRGQGSPDAYPPPWISPGRFATAFARHGESDFPPAPRIEAQGPPRRVDHRAKQRPPPRSSTLCPVLSAPQPDHLERSSSGLNHASQSSMGMGGEVEDCLSIDIEKSIDCYREVYGLLSIGLSTCLSTDVYDFQEVSDSPGLPRSRGGLAASQAEMGGAPCPTPGEVVETWAIRPVLPWQPRLARSL